MCLALEELPDDQSDTFLYLMGEPVEKAGNFAIGKAMRARGFQVSDLMISRCRKNHQPWTKTS